MRHVVLYSGGIGSWGAAYRLRQRMPDAEIDLLFTDTLIEDEDLYRFLEEGAASVGGNLIRIQDGRTPWEVFYDVKLMGNTRDDPCSRVLKRDLSRKWLDENCDPDETLLYVGIDIWEEHRFTQIQARYQAFGWTCQAPLCEPPYTAKHELARMLGELGIEPPRLYALGFPHNNCGGFCVKAGQAHFLNLLKRLPERFREHEEEELRWRDFIVADRKSRGVKPPPPGGFSILRDRSGGKTKPMTLRELRRRHEAGRDDQLDLFEWGGCGCFAGTAPEP